MARRETKRYRDLVERIVLDFEVGHPHTVEFPDPWKEEHEVQIRAALAFYRFTQPGAVEVGFVVDDELSWLGASPHALVGDDGCALFRPHRSLRKWREAQLKASRSDKARVQLLMHVCRRAWCDVGDYWDGRGEIQDKFHVERVPYQNEWLVANVFPRLVVCWRDVQARLKARDEAFDLSGRVC